MAGGRSIDDFEVPGGCGVEGLAQVADDLRQLAADFGGRPYQVFLVWVRFTRDVDADGIVDGLEEELFEGRDRGRPVLFREIELLPRPLVDGLDGLQRVGSSTGVEEQGSVTVEEISLRYHEDLLIGLMEGTRGERPGSLRDDLAFFWEIRNQRPKGYDLPGYVAEGPTTDEQPVRRRFSVEKVPTLRAFGFGWTVGLSRALGDRTRSTSVAETF